MKYLLDTNICIYIIKRKPPEVLARFTQHNLGDVGISSITVAELSYGIQKSQRIEQNQQALEQFLLPFEIAEFDAAAGLVYGKVRAILERKSTPIGSMDLLIAAQALSLGLIVVTNNVREFERVESLIVENWAGL